MSEDYMTLKWGTLKSWHISSEAGKELLKEFFEIGATFGAAQQNDTPRQKEIICELIDMVPGNIFLDWDCIYVSKDKAKKYVMEYHKGK